MISRTILINAVCAGILAATFESAPVTRPRSSFAQAYETERHEVTGASLPRRSKRRSRRLRGAKKSAA